MVSRRNVLKFCACGMCAAAIPKMSFGASASELDALTFYCGTPQITDFNPVMVPLADAAPMVTFDTGKPPAALSDTPYATAQRSLRWTLQNAGQSRNGNPLILVGFVDGSAQQQQTVQTHAAEWSKQGIALEFDFTEQLHTAHVRVSFGGGYNYSKVGSEALSIPSPLPTMHLPDVQPGAPDALIRRVILHEFGHALMTFGHEHRHPDAGFKFKPAAEIAQIINSELPPGAAPWTATMVETNITNPPYPRDRACTRYDVESIMHYPVESSWLIAGTPVPNPAANLSELDVACAVDVYKQVNT